MEILEKSYRSVMVRVAISLFIFVIFVITGVMAVVTSNTDVLFWVPILGIAAIFVLPRQTVPGGAKPEVAEARELWAKLSRMRLWLAYMRALYLVSAVFVLIGLPELI